MTLLLLMIWNHACTAMNTFQQHSEEELCEFIIQLNIQDSCQDTFLKTAARYADHSQTSRPSKTII